jgi:selenocysteine-specific elongation factor
MIIATAGHVDHGKTLLVKALTGVDADRLPEEKQRGMTIDLGFAYLPIESSETLGFVDVPGHERFVDNMLAGVAGRIDFALFIIAADDGPMPQTREHLAILDLLGIRNGAIALTKIDRVAPPRVQEVRNEIAYLFSSTTLAHAPVFPVSAVTGEGIEDLKSHLTSAARNWRPRIAAGNFRLAVDRCFSLSGAGLIVTGTAVSGSLAAGDAVRVLGAGLKLRARMIHVQNAASPTGRVGQRCAINLAGSGLKHKWIERGDWVVTGDVPEPARKFDAHLRVVETELRPLLHWTPVHVHVGAADVTGRVAILEGSSIAPGAGAFVQIVLDRPIGVLYGDGLIIRDQSAQRTIGGGRVLDVFPPVRGRAKPERLAYLKAIDTDDTLAALASLLRAAPRGLNLTSFAQNRNLMAEEAERLLSDASTRSVATPAGLIGFSPENWKRLKSAVVEALTALHRRAPAAIPNEERVLLEAGLRLPKEATLALAAELTREDVVVREATGIRLKAHAAQLSPADAVLWKKTESLLHENILRPPPLHEIAGAIGMDPKKAESFLVRASRLGLLVRVAGNRFYPPAGLRRLAVLVEEIAAGNRGSVTAAQVRDRTGIGRTLAIEVLEYFDRIKFTRRSGDQHEVLLPARDVLGDSAGGRSI